jgi:uncharacterized protein
VSEARDVVEVIARALVDDPEAVKVTETEQREVAVVELFVAPDDLGRVIGRQGRTASALRSLVGLAAEWHDFDATLEIREPR